MTQRAQYLLIRRDRFREFLLKLVGASADQVLSEIEKSIDVVDLSADDKLVRMSDVRDALSGVGRS